MRFSVFFTVAVLAFGVAGACPARAEYFVWKDEAAEVSFSYPDRWAAVHTQKPDEVYQIMAPAQEDHASCRLRVRDDKRFVIHPAHLADNIQREFVSKEFWKDYVGEYARGSLISVTDNAGLGRGFASYADMLYVSEVGPPVQKRGFAYASIHYDKMFIFECAAEASVYDKWQKPFLSILKSVEFSPVYSPYLNGHYRNFPQDPSLIIRGVEKTDTFIY